MKKITSLFFICIFFAVLFLTGCGKKSSSEVTYEIIGGEIVEVASSENSAPVIDNDIPQYEVAAGEAAYDGREETDGTAVFAGDEDYDTIAFEDSARIKSLTEQLYDVADAAREAYANADKGQGMNVSLSKGSLSDMLVAIGQAGYSVIDYNGEFNMQNYQPMDEFGKSIRALESDISYPYFIVYSDGHISAYNLYRESGRWHLLSMSGEWNEDCSFRIYNPGGRYAVGTVNYTSKGWLIFNRDTTDFDVNQQANTDSYTMLRVLPMDATCRQLCERYVDCVGYFENNLFTTTWSEANMGPIDFNSLYAYVFAMVNGTDMLSSYNIRNYYKAVGGSRLYAIPAGVFEENVQTFFNITGATLKNISDYNSSLGSYLFIGYNHDYYNVTPRTPFPEVISYVNNPDGSITMVVDAVNKWYGTDCAFRHELTVYPTATGFKYVSNTLMESEANIIPEQKLSAMLDVERAKTIY